MIRVGLLAESIFRSQTPIYFGTVHPDAWPALRLQFEMEIAEYLAVLIRGDDDEGYLVYASRHFQARSSPQLGKPFGIRGSMSIRWDQQQAAGHLLAAGSVEGAKYLWSDGWGQLILET